MKRFKLFSLGSRPRSIPKDQYLAGLEKTTIFLKKTGFFGLNRFLWFKPVFMVFYNFTKVFTISSLINITYYSGMIEY